MNIEQKKVKELRAFAKQKGITPVPTRKDDLIRALTPGDKSGYSMSELQAICTKHKEKLQIACSGKGITRKYLIEKLMQANLIMEVREEKLSEFEQQILDADPELHRVLELLAPHVLTLDFIVGSKVGRKKVSQSEDPWRFLTSEYSVLQSNRSRKDILTYLQKGEPLPPALHEDFVEFATALPLTTYSYLLQSESLQELADKLQLTQLFAISDILKGTNAFLGRSSDVETQAAAETEDMLSALPQEMLYEILERLPLEAVGNAIISSRSMADAEQHYRGLAGSYGSYLLSRAQLAALRWTKIQERNLLIIQAPPSWGKTALSIALAIDAVNDGKSVVIHTTPAMIPFFLDEMEEMMGKKFPDLKAGTASPGKYSILVPSISKRERERYLRGDQANILLVTVPKDAYRRAWRILAGRVTGPIQNYSPDLVLVDEAHKEDLYHLHMDYLGRNPNNVMIGFSASKVRHPGYAEVSTLQFSLASISDKVPDFTVEIRDIPSFVTDKYIDKRYPDISRTINRAEHLRQLDTDLIGNTVVFSWKPLLTSTQKSLQADLSGLKMTHQGEEHDLFTLYKQKVLQQPKSIVVYKGPATVKKFQDQSRKIPSTFFLTYNVGAEGLNLNTIDNIILLDAENMQAETIFQAVARAQRVSNQNRTIQVIAYSRPFTSSYLRVALKFSQGFQMSTTKIIKWSQSVVYKTVERYIEALRDDLTEGKNRPHRRYKRIELSMSLYSYIMSQRDRISARELAVIFEGGGSKLSPKDMISFFEREKILPEISPTELLVYMNGDASSLGPEDSTLLSQTEIYQTFLKKVRGIAPEMKVAQLDRERLRYVTM